MDEPLVALPIRSFRDAYRRLARSYSPDERTALARALAAHTAGTVLRAGVTPHVVTSATEVREWALAEGHRVVADPPGGGLDGAADEAVRLAAGRPWLILHSDLPCLSPDEVVLALEVARSGERVLAPSYDGGTSALGGRGRHPFGYGAASFHRHLTAGPPPRVITSLGFLLDIDRSAAGPGSRCLCNGATLARPADEGVPAAVRRKRNTATGRRWPPEHAQLLRRQTTLDLCNDGVVWRRCSARPADEGVPAAVRRKRNTATGHR